MTIFNQIRNQFYEGYTFAELCHMAGMSEDEANLHGLNRSEIIQLIFNQTKQAA